MRIAALSLLKAFLGRTKLQSSLSTSSLRTALSANAYALRCSMAGSGLLYSPTEYVQCLRDPISV